MNFKKILILFFLSITTLSYSQLEEDGDPGFGGGSGDPATEPVQTPIDNLLLPLLVTGIITAVVLIRKQQKQIHG